MKTVLFCGGLGLRLREFSGTVPKPMVQIGHRPIMWHVMKYYAHFGHKDFILCLGYQGKTIKDYFLNYNECISNNFTLSGGGKQVDLASKDIDDWTITFVDTGIVSLIGQRLKAVEPFLKDEEVFLANYSDNLTDCDLSMFVADFMKTDKIAAFISVKPFQSFHVVDTDTKGQVKAIRSITETDTWINGGYFIFRNEIFDYIKEGEELVYQPFQRLIKEGKLMTYKYNGFWACMDTFKEKQRLEEMISRGIASWKVWQNKESMPGKKRIPANMELTKDLSNAFTASKL